MLDKGITISLGTDSSSSNNNLDLFEELKLVAMLHKGIELDATLINAETALSMATKYGAQALWLDDQIGTLEVGKEADFIVIDTNSPFYQPIQNNPISHLVYSGSGRDVKDVYVQGKQLMKNRQLLTVDEERIYYESKSSHVRYIIGYIGRSNIILEETMKIGIIGALDEEIFHYRNEMDLLSEEVKAGITFYSGMINGFLGCYL